ncbi:proteinase-activated receptor 3 isoform X4 [Denticeps clupeoides]|uniref:proteinase-activated receptor 3 isoform X4 n=1 Tax=Denticeps clupeoides TaxID=299321 RepID=UPI0010A348F5|nr:proteinase-activated receptor 3-like isoform X4 [Denticeps clupeoides]
MEEAEMNKSSLLCKLHPEKIHTEVLPWLYLCLALLGFLTNGLVLLDLWKAEKKPMVIFTVNMVVSDIILCCSFLFRFAYLRLYLEWKSGSPICTLSQYGIIGIFYINIYCNMCFLLWTSLNRYATVVQPHNVLLQRTIIIQSDPGDCVKQQRNSYTHSITVLVAALNSCLNPTLYLIIRSTFCRKKRPVTHVTADNSRCNQDPGKHDITAPETI